MRLLASLSVALVALVATAAGCADEPMNLDAPIAVGAARTQGDDLEPTPAAADTDTATDDAVPDAPIATPAPAAPKSYARGNSTGCGNAKSGAKGVQARSMMIAGKARPYIRVVPADYKPTKAYPVVFALHGSGGTADKARTGFGLEGAAGGKAIFIYPQGLPDPAFDNANRWATEKDSDDFTLLDALIAEVEASHCVDQDRIFMTGFSHGARMTSMVGCFRGDVFRAIAPVAAGGTKTTLPLAAGCTGEVSIWSSVGTEDTDHLEGAAIVRDHYQVANACTPTRTPTLPAGCEQYTDCRSPLRNVWCSYPGGHKWPAIGATGVWGFFDTTK